MPTKIEDRVIFLCGEHQFVIVGTKRTIDCHGTPGHRVKGCATCDQAVNDALAHIGWAKGQASPTAEGGGS